MKFWKSLHPRIEIDVIVEEEEENFFDPEAGKASDDPFAHLASEDAPLDEAASEEIVSKYVAGEEE